MALTQVGLGMVDSASAGGLSFRNKIINGDMRIDQRVSGTITATNTWMVDRFYQSHNIDGAQSFQQVTDAPDGFFNSIKYTTTTADASLASTQYSMLRYKMEGYTLADLSYGTAAAKTATLSFWVKSSATGTFGGTLINSASDRVYPYTYTINASNTWEKKIVVIPGDTTGTWLNTNGNGLEIKWSFGAGSTYTASATGAWQAGFAIHASGATSLINTLNATWQLTGVQFEVGSQATEFERRPFGTELALCQRYCWNVASDTSILTMFNGVSRGSGTYFYNIPTPVPMRTTPSFSVGGTGTVRITYAGTEVNSSANSSTVGGAAPTFNFGTSVANRTSILMSYETVSGVSSAAGRADIGLTFNYGTFIFSAEL